MDILTVLIAIVLIAVMAAATGSIFEQVGLPNILGSVAIVLLCGLLNFKGSKVIEKFESIGTILSGIIAGLLMVIPWFLSYFAMMCFYGDTSIVGADVETPWVQMILASGGGTALPVLFSIVMGWTLVETSTGCIHMIIDRFDVALEEKGLERLTDSKQGSSGSLLQQSAAAGTAV